MVRHLGIILTIVLLFAVSSYGYDLTSYPEYRKQVYQMLGYDTAGVDGLDTSAVNRYVYMGVNHINTVFKCYEKTEVLTTADGGRFVVLDSCAYLTGCSYVSNDTTKGMRVIRTDDVRDSVISAESYEEDALPEFVYLVKDSLRFIPTPKSTDSFLVHYVHVIPNLDSNIYFIDPEYRDAVVFYSAYLSALDSGSPRRSSFIELFNMFLMSHGEVSAK